MSTPATSADVRTPPDRAATLKRELEEARTEAQLMRAKAALRRLKESAALDYDWYGPWSEVQRQRDGDRAWVPVGGTHARRHGHYFPFFQNEQQLATLRDLSRVVVGTNNHAAGMLNGLTSFVIGTGFKTKVTPTNGNKALAQQVTDWLDEWAAANCWDEFQQEAFARHREDGDELIRMFPDDGCLKIRHVWPEQLTQPPGTGDEWLYGVLMPDGDTAAPEAEAYAIADVDDPAQIEIVPAAEMVHFKANTRTGVKRGLPDFSFGTKDALDAAGRLTRNLGEGAAIREAIAFMRQHAAATESDVTAFTSADADFKERDPARESYRPVNIWAPGTVVDFPEGMEHAGAPANPGTAAHASVVQILLRSAGVRWNAPEWLVSGDASNMGAYTSSLVAESPFVLSVRRAQGYYRPRFLRIVRKAIALAVASGYLPGDAMTAVKVDLVPPSPEVRNKLEEAQRAQTEITLGVDSRQRYCEEQGRDWEQIAKENQEYQDQFGSPGQQLPTDPFGGAGGAGGDTGGGAGLPLPESWVQTSALGRALLESGFTGEITDAAGRHRKYVDGKQVAAGEGGGAGGANAAAGGGGAKPPVPLGLPDPGGLTKPKTKAALKAFAAAVDSEWKRARDEIAVSFGTREINDRMNAAAVEAENAVFATLRTLSSGEERVGLKNLGPVSDQRYRELYTQALFGIARLRHFAATHESLDERGAIGRALLEAGFTGTVKDSAGRERHYVDGKQVAAAKNDDGGNGDKNDSHAKATPEERKAVEDDLAEKLGPEAAKKPGLLARVADVALTAATKVYAKMIEWEPAAHKIASLLGNVIDTPDDMKKFGYNPTFGGSQNASVGNNDPIAANLGIGGHMAIGIAANVISRAILYAKGKLSGTKTEAEYDGVQAVAEMLADLFAAINKELGATGGAPSADEVAANIKKLLGAN